MLRQVNPYMSKYKIPREILEHVEDILDKKTLGEKGYVAIILNPIKDDEVDVPVLNSIFYLDIPLS